jgi:hypothetical protein
VNSSKKIHKDKINLVSGAVTKPFGEIMGEYLIEQAQNSQAEKNDVTTP